ncbi:hypothetical protein PC116_g2023 [Phytophthora cactorum]|nr:hypothetical protein PC116_g2023 [Phytophthora cactorum]
MVVTIVVKTATVNVLYCAHARYALWSNAECLFLKETAQAS